jgi:hypothetical protein
MREIMLASQTLPDFQQYLLSRKLVPGKSVTFYAYWANPISHVLKTPEEY